MSTTTPVEVIEHVLSAHADHAVQRLGWGTGRTTLAVLCDCGARTDLRGRTPAQAHRAHVAERIDHALDPDN